MVNYELEKFRLENSIKLIEQFRICASHTDEIKWELDSIEKFYKIKLYALKRDHNARVDQD